MTGILADRLYRSIVGMLGSDEHLQIAGLLSRATRIVVEREAALTVRDHLDRNPWAFECNLDVIRPPEGPEWIEWPIPTRSGHGGEEATTGCLLVPHPEERGVAMVVTGWDREGAPARHALAVASLDLEQLYELAWNARNRFSRTPDESLERIMSCISVTMPEGFRDEISIVIDDQTEATEAIEAAMRDATSEVPFALALAIAIRSKGGLSLSEGDGHTVASLAAPMKQGLLSRTAAKLTGKPEGRFARKVRDGMAEVTWYRNA